ncbi:MAG TPA: hypothetical protein VGP43_11755 [Chitinophagaceae bacterium]|nr:hypothetical protein [Chitinophagaceae bacterium]
MPDHTQTTFYPWLIPVIAAGLGFVAAILLEKFRNRIVLLKFSKNIFQLATSTQHNFWGNIEVLYNNRKTNHLSLITVEIKNDSNRDLENVKVDFWVDESSQMLAHQGNYIESGNFIPYDENYQKELSKVIELYDDMKLEQMDFKDETPELAYRRRSLLANKKFNLPVLNRNTSVKFQILAENFEGEIPTLSLSVLHKSCKLVREEDEIEIKKKRDKYVGIIWLILLFISIAIFQSKFHNIPYIIIWTGVFSFLLLYFALGIYHFIKFITKIWR